MGGSCLERLPRQLSPTNLAALSGQLSVSVPPQLRTGSWDVFLPAAALTDTFFCQNKMKQTQPGTRWKHQPFVSSQVSAGSSWRATGATRTQSEQRRELSAETDGTATRRASVLAWRAVFSVGSKESGKSPSQQMGYCLQEVHFSRVRFARN